MFYKDKIRIVVLDSEKKTISIKPMARLLGLALLIQINLVLKRANQVNIGLSELPKDSIQLLLVRLGQANTIPKFNQPSAVASKSKAKICQKQFSRVI